MKVGRLTKDSADFTRVTLDCTQWLDPNEVIAGVTTPTVVIEQNATWQNGPWTNTPPPPPVDTTPLVVPNCFIVPSQLMVELILSAGTPGLTYKVTLVVSGSSSLRQKQVDILVTVRQPL